jgi:biotin transport system substrate-specific component
MSGPALLIDRIWPRRELARDDWVRFVALALLGAVLVAFDSWIGAPAQRPISLQSFAVLAFALAYGPRLGLATFALFLGAGLLGIPAYPGASTWGWSFVLAPDFGRYLGYGLAVAAVGFLAERGALRSWSGRIATPLLGQVLIYAVSIPWLAAYLAKGSGFPFAAMLGVAWTEETLPFLVADFAKALAAALVIWGAERALAQR